MFPLVFTTENFELKDSGNGWGDLRKVLGEGYFARYVSHVLNIYTYIIYIYIQYVTMKSFALL